MCECDDPVVAVFVLLSWLSFATGIIDIDGVAHGIVPHLQQACPSPVYRGCGVIMGCVQGMRTVEGHRSVCSNSPGAALSH